MEIYSSLLAVLIAGVNAFAAIDYMCALQIPIWYAPQLLIPHFTVSSTFFLGRGPHRLEQLIAVRSRVYTTVSLLLSVVGFVVGCVFMGLKIAYYYSSEAPAELKANGGVFVVLMLSCATLLPIYGFNIYTIILSWYRSRTYHGEYKSS